MKKSEVNVKYDLIVYKCFAAMKDTKKDLKGLEKRFTNKYKFSKHDIYKAIF